MNCPQCGGDLPTNLLSSLRLKLLRTLASTLTPSVRRFSPKAVVVYDPDAPEVGLLSR